MHDWFWVAFGGYCVGWVFFMLFMSVVRAIREGHPKNGRDNWFD